MGSSGKKNPLIKINWIGDRDTPDLAIGIMQKPKIFLKPKIGSYFNMEDKVGWPLPKTNHGKSGEDVRVGSLSKIPESSELALSPKHFVGISNSSGDSGAMSMRANFDGHGSISQDTHNMQDESEEHNTAEGNFKWDNDMQFWVMYLGQTIGFGSIWRFPSVIYHNGGSAF